MIGATPPQPEMALKIEDDRPIEENIGTNDAASIVKEDRPDEENSITNNSASIIKDDRPVEVNTDTNDAASYIECDRSAVENSIINNAGSIIKDDFENVNINYAANNDDTDGSIVKGALEITSERKASKSYPGRKGIKALFYLTVPLALLFFFLLGDTGKVATYPGAYDDGTYTQWNVEEVKDFHFRKYTLNAPPKHVRDVLVRLPESFKGVDEETMHVTMTCPRGVLFLFHGCHRYAASFFYSPQGRRIVSMALEQGLVIVAFKKFYEEGCWKWELDGHNVLAIGKKFLESRYKDACTNEEGMTVYPPNYAFGASAGGQFIAELADRMKKNGEDFAPFLFSAMNIQISPPAKGLDWDVPTMFTVMDGDEEMKQNVTEFIDSKSNSKSRPVQIVTSGRKKIEWNHFAKVFEDDPQMTDARSNQIYTHLATAGVISASTNEILVNPRASKDATATIADICQKYRVMARQETAKSERKDPSDVTPFGVSQRLVGGLTGDEFSDAECIWLIEELNVAFDRHEITAEGFENVLDFFFSH